MEIKDKGSSKVIVDVEYIIDRLIKHANEDNCSHSVMDLLTEFFHKNKNCQEIKAETSSAKLDNENNLNQADEISEYAGTERKTMRLFDE